MGSTASNMDWIPSSAKSQGKIAKLISVFRASGWPTSTLAGALITLVLIASWRGKKLRLPLQPKRRSATEPFEPGLFKRASSFQQFTTPSGHIYPRIRAFYHAHPQAGTLPKDLPLLVFMHGLGGNAMQFAPLLTSLINLAPCLAIDLPGCGSSNFKPDELSAYTTAALAELLFTAIDHFRDAGNDQKVIFIGHSMGCSIAALLASSTSPKAQLMSKHTAGVICICPRASLPDAKEAERYRWLRWTPPWALDLLRLVDRRGGLESASITRIVGQAADEETRRLQRTFNRMSKSAVLLRMILAAWPSASLEVDDGSTSSLPGQAVWSGIKVPLYLIAAEADHLATPKDVEQIASWLTKREDRGLRDTEGESEVALDAAVLPIEPPSTQAVPTTASDAQLKQFRLSSSGDSGLKSNTQNESIPLEHQDHASRHTFALKTTIFPAPASHALMYDTSTVRILTGLIESFIAHHIDERLSFGWQLQHLTTSGKWEVKNLAKWRKVDPCSKPIGGIFRALKTMREVDDMHNPTAFVQKFGSSAMPDGVAVVVDISHDSPVYNPKGLEEGGVEYHKFPTVSKLPPTAVEVERFISLIDRLRQSPKLQCKEPNFQHATIGVHCHYGFNRTGFFIICYLVERCGYKLQDAIEEFAEKRAPGIKHAYFINELYVRYAVKMDRRGTIVG